MKRAFVLLLAILFLLPGCAKYPATGTGATTTRLVFKLTVKGQLHTGQGVGGNGLPYVYVVALNLSKDDVPTTTGPVPIVVPSGNGIVSGDATHFILWNPLASPQYQIYKFNDTLLTNYFQTGVPVNYVTTSDGDRTMQFEIDLSQLVPASEVSQYKSVQVNFLTMNNTNTSGGGRIWDALGDARISSQINFPFTVRLNTANTYTNTNQGSIEPEDDCPDPDLDLSDWSVEVRLQ